MQSQEEQQSYLYTKAYLTMLTNPPVVTLDALTSVDQGMICGLWPCTVTEKYASALNHSWVNSTADSSIGHNNNKQR